MNRLFSALTSRTPRARWIALAALILVTLAFVLLLRSIGVTHVTRYGHDTFIFLDGGWRVNEGQRPHIDFHTPLGMIVPLLVGLAMKLGGADATALGLAVILFVVATIAWAWLLARRRLAPALGLLLALLVGAIGIGQYTLSFDYQETSHASIFNRFGYAVLSLLLVECTLPLSDPKRRGAALIGGISSGAALAILFFIKPSFVPQGVVFIGLGALVARRCRVGWLGVAVGVLASSALLLLLARTSLSAVLHDYAVGASSRSGSLASHDGSTVFLEMGRRDALSMTPEKILEVIRVDFWPTAALVVMGFLVPKCAPGLRSRRAVLAIVVVVLVSSLPTVFLNWQWGEIPTTPVLAIVLAELALRPRELPVPPASETRLAVALPLVALLAFVWGGFAVKNYGSVVASWSWHRAFSSAYLPGARIDAAPLAKLLILRADGPCRPLEYGARINDGLALLASESERSGDPLRIFVPDFSNPFSFALHAEPPRGDLLWWHFSATFDEKNLPGPEDALRDVNVIMVPECAEEPRTTAAIMSLYAAYIDREFENAGRSRAGDWTALRRRRGAPAHP